MYVNTQYNNTIQNIQRIHATCIFATWRGDMGEDGLIKHLTEWLSVENADHASGKMMEYNKRSCIEGKNAYYRRPLDHLYIVMQIMNVTAICFLWKTTVSTEQKRLWLTKLQFALKVFPDSWKKGKRLGDHTRNKTVQWLTAIMQKYIYIYIHTVVSVLCNCGFTTWTNFISHSIRRSWCWTCVKCQDAATKCNVTKISYIYNTSKRSQIEMHDDRNGKKHSASKNAHIKQTWYKEKTLRRQYTENSRLHYSVVKEAEYIGNTQNVWQHKTDSSQCWCHSKLLANFEAFK